MQAWACLLGRSFRDGAAVELGPLRALLDAVRAGNDVAGRVGPIAPPDDHRAELQCLSVPDAGGFLGGRN